MRIKLQGVRRHGAPIQMRFEGAPVDAYAGETVAAALVAAGISGFRETADGQRRGVFCGMGVCGECVVDIDGVPRRACLTPARDGMQLARQPALAVAAAAVEAPVNPPWEERTVDVLVIGAGPAGLAAARAAAGAGAQVLLADERLKAGGQYFKQPGEGFEIDEAALDKQFSAGRALYAAAKAAGVEFLFGATVWGTFSEGEVGVLTADRCLLIRPRRLILSPGAYERAIAVPGWTLPGVMTTGAAQTLIRAYQTSPGQRVLIAGNGPLNLQVAHELARAGITVVAVAETARAPGPRALASLARMAAASPALVATGIVHVGALWRHGVPVKYRHALVAAHGDEHVTSATLARIDADGAIVPGSEQSYQVDAVCMGYGFLPQAELARALGCEHRWDSARGALFALRDGDGRTSVPGVYIAGDAGAMGGAQAALAQGALAGLAVARELDLPATAAQETERRRAQRIAARHRSFQAALWALYQAPLVGLRYSRPDTPVCRCENVDLQTLQAEFNHGPASLGTVKRLTRAGMGRCQGRYCSTLLAELAIAAGAEVDDDSAFFAPRTPFKPTPIGRIAARGEVLARKAATVENNCSL
jgi:NADPH-dependent 2,4-dienoyl-CoA reductase/sulfur reductase-like enzyme